MKKAFKISRVCLASALALISVEASATTVVLTKLTGTTGANSGTAVYGASLNALPGTFNAISITDTSGNFGGSTGQFSGFDLDAIKLSTTNCADAACVAGAAALAVFDFTSGVTFSPGSQRAPVDSKLFGTGPAGNTLDNTVATLGAFDAFSSTVTPAGFLSLGDNGSINFNLTSALSGSGLYLYIGEVGDNGEVAGSNINLTSVPEPATWAMMMLGLGAVAAAMRRRPRAALRFNFA